MSEKIIVLVSDPGDSKHGEISVLDDPHKAERLVETLLEAGFEEGRIQVFTGRESDFQVSQRPVVALLGEDGEGEPQPTVGIGREEATAAQPSPPVEETESGSKEEAESKEEQEEVAAAAEEAAPVRFSSLFRSA